MIKRGYKIRRYKSKSAQVWIETVIYTLIGFIMIGLVIAYARPKIECMQDKAILDQSKEMIRTIDSEILSIGGAGNRRILRMGIREGTLRLDCANDKIIFESETGKNCQYSEPGQNFSDGDIIVLSQKRTDSHIVTLTRDYSSKYNLKFNGQEVLKEIIKASNPYRLSISNEGRDSNDKIILNMSLI